MKHLFLLIGFCLSFGLFAQGSSTVVISEIMANPKGLTQFPETEYVELQNVSSQPVSLADWWFYYADKGVQLADVTLPAQGFVVLYRSGREIIVDKEGLQMPLAAFPAQLSNDGKQLALYDATHTLQDAIDYPKAKAARSWEREGDGWTLCNDSRGGTPGSGKSDSESQPEKPTTPDTPKTDYSKGSLRINEIMADPKGLVAFPQTEYIELFNTTNAIILLAGWQFVYGEKTYELPDYIIPAKSYVVIYAAHQDIWVEEHGARLPLEKFPTALANAGKELALRDPMGNEIDQVTYGKAKAGRSWERAENGELYLSTDPRGGTPGSVNSPQETPPADQPVKPEDPDMPSTPELIVKPGEIVINELLPAPLEGGTEYLELYNRSNRTLPLAGLALASRRTDGSLGTHYPLAAIQTLEAGGYALLSKDLAGVEAFYHIASPEALYEVKPPLLANGGACIVLFRIADEVIIDEVTYSSKWHDSAIKDPKGVALERTDPDGPSQEASNWHSAAESAGYGTPGYRNSQQLLPPTHIEGFESPQWIEMERNYQLHYQLPEAGYRCRIWVFDTTGRRIAEIANTTTLATEGTLSWDGSANDGSRPKPGVYICYIELFHPNGKTRSQRTVFLMH